MKSGIESAFETWGIEHAPGSAGFRSLCAKRYVGSKSLDLALTCLPVLSSHLWKDGQYRCLLWDEASITTVLRDRNTDRFLPIGTLGDGSWLALDLAAGCRELPVVVFPFCFYHDDEWRSLSPDNTRLLSHDYADYLQVIHSDPRRELLIGIRDLTMEDVLLEMQARTP
jgi:hypothetical protein